VKTYPVLFYGIIVEQSDRLEMLLNIFRKGISHLVYVFCLVGIWFEWCLVFISGELVHVVSADVGLCRCWFVCHLCQVCGCLLASKSLVALGWHFLQVLNRKIMTN